MVMVEAVPVVLNNEVEKEMPVGMVAIPTSTSKELVSAIVTSDAPEAAIHVRAYVDGRSHLSIKGNTVQWLHLDNAAPGRLNDYPIINDHPTFIDEVSWMPVWPDESTMENRDCGCKSEVAPEI